MTIRPTSSLFFAAAVALAVLALVAGCGKSDRPPLGKVSGTVTLDGQPLPEALVLFTPDGPGRTSQGVTDASGRYSVTYLRDIVGANLGRHMVRITTAREETGAKELLPAKYHAKTTLSATVSPGDNVVDFALDSK
jgi:hypothetical protein